MLRSLYIIGQAWRTSSAQKKVRGRYERISLLLKKKGTVLSKNDPQQIQLFIIFFPYVRSKYQCGHRSCRYPSSFFTNPCWVLQEPTPRKKREIGSSASPGGPHVFAFFGVSDYMHIVYSTCNDMSTHIYHDSWLSIVSIGSIDTHHGCLMSSMLVPKAAA